MSCYHFKYIQAEPVFLTPLSNKVIWMCLYDGCIKIKKPHSKQQLCIVTEKFTEEHKLLINCQTLQIYCTECKKQIYDTFSQGEEVQAKEKKKQMRDPRQYREMLVQRQSTEDILFAGNLEYPLSFQKQKKGFCGLKANAINSYLNSIIQLIAGIPIFQDISSQICFEKVQNKILGQILKTIDAIWSGQYRVYKLQQLQKELIKQDNKFKSYRYKNPHEWLYFILKKIQQEFGFHEVDCNQGQITSKIFQQWKQNDKFKEYSLFRQIFGGQCILEKVCSKCGQKQLLGQRFEWLRVNYEKSKYHDSNVQIEITKLIDESFSWKNKYEDILKKMEEGQTFCGKCKEKIRQYYTYVNLPNHLILQFGEGQEGLNVSLPDEIDLSKYVYGNAQKVKGESGMYEYVGSIFRRQKKYIAHLRHSINKKQYNILDQVISQNKRITDNTKIALYKRITISNHKNIALYKNIASCLEVNINPIVPMPDFWSLLLKHHHIVPPLLNPYICTHAKLKDNHHISKIKQGPQKIPIEIYTYLLQIFGGRQIDITKEQDICSICTEIYQNIASIKNSQKQMANFADKLSHKKDRVLINRSWLQQWRKYIYEDGRKGYKSFTHKRPKFIQNNNVEEDKMKKISPEVWYFLQKFYGGGPLMAKNEYHPNIVLTASVNLRFQAIKTLIKSFYGKEHECIQMENPKGNTQLVIIQQLQEND